MREDTRHSKASAAGSTRKGRLLGSITKSASRGSITDDKILKYYLQSVARELAPHHRVRSCLRARVPKTEAVEIWYSDAKRAAYYSNLIRCGSVWVCPLCASTITERRVNELTKILTTREAIPNFAGDTLVSTIYVPRWYLGMATFTLAHRKGVPLARVLHSVERAYKSMWGGRWAVGFKQHYHVVGTIRAIEITYGRNGWHPHIHLLLIRRSQPTTNTTIEIFHDLQLRWLDSVSMAGGVADEIHGVDYRDAQSSAVEYVAKLGANVIGDVARWSAIHELVKSPAKRGRLDSATLWDLLAAYAAGNVEAGELWIEAQRALKGKRHLVPSRGLYQMLGAYVSDNTDAWLSKDAADASDILLASLTPDEWRKIIHKNLRGQVISVAKRGDHKLLMDYLESIL